MPQAARITDLCAKFECAPAHRTSSGEVKAVEGKLIAGQKELTPRFEAIQSFDVSFDRREVVFSAKRADAFHIGLVSLDGSEVHWFPAEPVDETDVQWAPRGNKVSYVVHTKVGDVVRTVHVPTAMQLSVDFPYARVRALAWDPAAERYAVVVSSAEASERIESVKYSGEERRTIVPPATHLDVVVEPMAGGLMLRPPMLHYGERIPLVVWISGDPFVWNDARAMLIRNTHIGCVIMRAAPDDTFWSAIAAVPWIDIGRSYVVGARSERGVSIIPVDHSGYRISKNEVLVPRADVESFAAFWIAQQLKDRNGVR